MIAPESRTVELTFVEYSIDLRRTLQALEPAASIPSMTAYLPPNTIDDNTRKGIRGNGYADAVNGQTASISGAGRGLMRASTQRTYESIIPNQCG